MGAVDVVARRADLDLGTVQRGIGVDDERAEVAADVEHDLLGMRTVGMVLGHGFSLSCVAAPAAAMAAGGRGSANDGVSKPSCGVPRYGNVDR